ncbi:MAG: hypothetical protein LBI60_03305 [Bacteroidales bacterium]|jgi:hypothetical protein|nr:hypothetical protein [Bacteroidales bacterium]
MKTGDKIYLTVGNNISFCEVVGFLDYCTELKSGNFHIRAAKYHQGLFYGYGYNNGITKQARNLFLKKWWHYYPAIICERIRVNMPYRLARRLKLEK